jgi:uncharacterized protein YcaQ
VSDPADLSLGEARRIALAAQGFDRPRPNGRVDARHLRRTIGQLGLLQIDYVNVLVPAQYQVPFSRLGAYERSRLDDLVYRGGEFTERWAHAASIVPMESWSLLRHRMEAYRARPQFASFIQRHAEYVDWVLAEVGSRGPLTADDLPEPEGVRRRSTGWWSRTVPRMVLEWHFTRGLLAVVDRRPDFSRVYDLVERVIQPEHHGRIVEREEAQRELLRRAARSHGVAAVGDLADYYRMPVREARPRIAELVEAGELRRVRVEGWREPALLHPDARLPRRIDAAALLSPFDPVVWERGRTARLFEFDYRIEIFVPRPQRQFGYYVLPFLLGDRLVARVDLKADRKARRLLVQAAYLEPKVRPGEVADVLAAELWTMARWLGLDSVVAGRRGGFARPLAAAVRA